MLAADRASMLRGMAVDEHPERVQALLEGLNEPQREAVTHGEGPLLILAGAGSGKTRVLTHRVAFLIFTEQAHPSEILAITFTNKAAQEMRGRVERLLGGRTRGMWLMTFHAACARILRAHAERLGYTRHVHDLRPSRLAAAGQALHRGGRRRPQALHAGGRPQPDLAGQEQAALAVGLRAGDRLAVRAGAWPRCTSSTRASCMRMNAMDFDDLLFRTVDLLELFEEVRDALLGELPAHARRRVPGHQPRPVPAAATARRVAGVPSRRAGERVEHPGHRNLAVVGDDSQSIYGFRGADVRNILDFTDDFPTRVWSSWSRTTARRRRSSRPPMR